jgi:hypothetical protein
MLLFALVLLQKTQVLEAVTVMWALEEVTDGGGTALACRSF